MIYLEGKHIIITEGDLKGKTGVVIDLFYEGWGYNQYTVLLDEDKKEYILYHDEIEEIK